VRNQKFENRLQTSLRERFFSVDDFGAGFDSKNT
jgi:hypothetical protein